LLIQRLAARTRRRRRTNEGGNPAISDLPRRRDQQLSPAFLAIRCGNQE
jgi:hypothetical protein